MDQLYHKGRLQCSFGKEVYAICIDSHCSHPAALCQEGFNTAKECGHFHSHCKKVIWKEVTDLVGHNPHVCCPDFHFVIDKMDSLFLKVLDKVRVEHEQFRFWVKTYGYSFQTMKFIKKISQNNFQNFTGQQLNEVVPEILNSKRLQHIPIVKEEEIILLQNTILKEIGNISSIYLKPGHKHQKNINVIPLEPFTPQLSQINSKIVNQVDTIKNLFSQKVNNFELLFRASQKKYDIKQFHKACDQKINTLVLIQTQFGKIIGGFTPVAWSSSKKHWAPDKQKISFIFNLSHKQKYPLNLIQFSIANNPQKGPIFGCCDICIVDKSHKERCNAQFPISYNNGKYVRSPQTSFAFTGHPKGKFLTKEWQVFQVTFND